MARGLVNRSGEGESAGSAKGYRAVARARSAGGPTCRAEAPEAAKADVAQLAEHVLGKDEVTSSILVIGSILRSRMQAKDP
jgi:hypothetical protein